MEVGETGKVGQRVLLIILIQYIIIVYQHVFVNAVTLLQLMVDYHVKGTSMNLETVISVALKVN